MNLSAKEKELASLLCELSFEESDIPNERENAIIVIMLAAREDNAIDRYIDIVKSSKEKTLNEVMSVLFKDCKVEISDDDEDESERVAV